MEALWFGVAPDGSWTVPLTRAARDPQGEVVSIAFRAESDYAVFTYADGPKEIRKCTLLQASEWAGAAGLTIVLAAGDFFVWERLAEPVTDSLEGDR
jgi:hypothetical protein